MYEQIRYLSKSHIIDLLQFSTSSINYLNPSEFCNSISTIQINVPKNFFTYIIFVYFQLPSIYKRLANEVNIKNYDAAIIHHCYFTQSPYILRFLKIPKVYICHEPKREFYEKIPETTINIYKKIIVSLFLYPLKFIDRRNARSATLILANSNFSQNKIFSAYGVKPKINYPGVNTNIFKITNDIKKENRVITVGALTLLKGHDFIIKSLAAIPFKRRPQLLIIGNGGRHKEYIKRLAKELKVNCVIKENISDQELVYLYNRSKLFLYAPINEPFGLTTLEAMACGTKVVCTKGGGPQEIVEKMGEVVDRDIDDFSKAIEKCIKENYSSNKIRNYVVSKFDWEMSINNLIDYLNAISAQISH